MANKRTKTRIVSTLLSSGANQLSTPWSKLTEQGLQLLHARWRLVASSLTDLVPAAQWKQLGLKQIDVPSVTSLLNEVGPEKIRCEQLTTPERDQVIRDIDDLDLLRDLVIHPDRDGNLHAINDRTFSGKRLSH